MKYSQSSSMFFQSLFSLFLLIVLVQAASITKPSSNDGNNNLVEPLKKLFKEEGRGLARIDATLKQYLGNPLTGIVYAASLAIGAISLLAMYESPLSPLPVPSLPKPPVGRFPPEHPVWPPVSKHPVKIRQQQSMPYAASNMNPVYEMAPQFIGKQQLVSSYEDNNNWLSPQNLVQSFAAQNGNGGTGTGGMMGSAGALAPPRRSDYTLQPYQSSKMHLPLNHNWKQQQPQPMQPQQQSAVLATPSQPALVSPGDAVTAEESAGGGGGGGSGVQGISNQDVNSSSNGNQMMGPSSSPGHDYNIQPDQQ